MPDTRLCPSCRGLRNRWLKQCSQTPSSITSGVTIVRTSGGSISPFLVDADQM